MDVSIIIVSYNGRDFLRRCLQSVYRETRDVDFDVVVVDNASVDGTAEMVREEFQQARLVERKQNGGFARGVNEGAAETSGSHLLVLNPDAELTTNILPPLLRHVRSNADIAILAPKIVDPDGSVQLSCRRFPGFTSALFNRYSLLTRVLPTNPFSRRYLMSDFDHAHIADADWVSAACWLVPRSAYERIGPLDEGYFWSIEDVDYCQRAHRAGLRVVYYPEVSVLHHIGGSSRTLPATAIEARHRGMWRYYRTHMRPRRQPVRAIADTSVWCGIQARCLWQLGTSRLKGVDQSPSVRS